MYMSSKPSSNLAASLVEVEENNFQQFLEPPLAISEVEVEKNNLQQLLERPLAIPEYQRRYCWKQEQVLMLLKDIERLLAKEDGPPLFLGTVILHLDDDGKANLVDGQQRCLTLVLVLKMLNDLTQQDAGTKKGMSSLLKSTFSHSLSQQCLAENNQQIKTHFQNETVQTAKDMLKILYNKLEFVVITISSIDQAFAFFDSQNSAGKRLSDFDLLKARHLRGIISLAKVGVGCSHIWEQYENIRVGGDKEKGPRLAYYLAENLLANARVRQRNNSIERMRLESEFPVLTTKSKTEVGTGTRLVQLSPPTSASFYRDWDIDVGDLQSSEFPFTFSTQLTISAEKNVQHTSTVDQLPLQMQQALIGGEQFFFFIAKYTEIYKQLFPLDWQEKESVEKQKEKLRETLWSRLLARHRNLELGQSAGYSRLIDIWLSLIIFYVDRFEITGEETAKTFERFVMLADQYVFSLRITFESLKRNAIEKHFHDNQLFTKLLQLPTVDKVNELLMKLVDKQASEIEKIEVDDLQTSGVRWHYIKNFYNGSGCFYSETSSQTKLHAAAKALAQKVIDKENNKDMEK
jgi:hypothetical protein